MEENGLCSFSLASADVAVSHSASPRPSPSAQLADPTLKRLSVSFLQIRRNLPVLMHHTT
jgi:hypothetical protein